MTAKDACPPRGGKKDPPPGLDQEYTLLQQGYRLIAGLDEAGRGAWAGPVYAAAVILPLDRPDLAQCLQGVTDSKLLTPQRREELLDVIYKVAISVGVGAATAAEIDTMRIVPATRLAMQRAIEALSPAPHALLLDYISLADNKLPQHSLPKADRYCLTVAAASIVAKVSRDRWMIELDRRFPGYEFSAHKGYGTANHRSALARLGACPEHRMSWAPLRPLQTEQNPDVMNDTK
jgi:ribonuclease HII